MSECVIKGPKTNINWLVVAAFRYAVCRHTMQSMWGIENVKQFKFIQKGKKEYELLINLKEKEGVNKELIIAKFKKILGQDANVSIKYVDEIPTLKSGKVKYIENLYKG